VRSTVKGEQAYSGRAVEVQLAEQEATTAQYWVGGGGKLIGLFGSKEKCLPSKYRLRISLGCWIKISAPKQIIRIALLRPWPFSSTTVALESCSSEPFPKERLYISEKSGRDALPRRPGSHHCRIVGGPP
jgi:hypothetical protein